MASKKKTTAKKKKKPSDKKKLTPAVSEEIRSMYVHGTEGIDGKRVFPTLDNLALDFNVAQRTLFRRSKDEAWVEQREIFKQKLQVEIDEGKRKEIAKQSIDFDSKNLALAKVIQNEIVGFLNNASNLKKYMASPHLVVDKNGQQRFHYLVDEDGNDILDDEGNRIRQRMEHPGDPYFIAVTPTAMTMISNSLTASQKVGRLALGEHTEKYNVEDSSASDAALADAVAELFGFQEHVEGNKNAPGKTGA